MSRRTLRFVFDYESPNAWIAWTQLYLAGQDPLDPERVAQWRRKPRASSNRKACRTGAT